MALLMKHTFTGGAGTFTLNGITPDFLDASWSGTTFNTGGVGTYTRDGAGYATADAARKVFINIPGGQQTTHSWVVEIWCKYDKATPSTSDNFDFGTYSNAGDTQEYFTRCTYNSGAGNYYQMTFRRLPAAVFGPTDVLGERTEDSAGNPITAGGGTNPSAGDMRFYMKKVGTTFYHGYDVGRGIKWFASGTDATTDADGVPWFTLYSGTWKVNSIRVWTNTDKNFVESGMWNPTIDPASMARIKRVFDMAVETAIVGPGNGAWIAETGQGLTNPWTNYTTASGKFRTGIKVTAGTHGYCFHQADGLIRSRNCTFGFWVKMDTAWATWTGNLAMLYVGSGGGYPEHVYISRASATAFSVFTQVGKGASAAEISGTYNFPFGDVPAAGDIVCFFISIRTDGRLEVGVNANLAKLASGTNPSFTIPAISNGDWFECTMGEDGLVPLVTKTSSTRNPNCTVSDIFVLDSVHWPNHAIPAALPNMLTCDMDTAPTGVLASTKHAGCLSRKKSSGNFAPFAAGRMGIMRDSAKKVIAVMAELSANANGSTANVPGTTAGSPWFYNWTNIDNDLAWAKQCLDFGGGDFGYYHVDLGGVPRRLQDAAGPTVNYMAIGTDTTEGQGFVGSMPNDGTNTGTWALSNVVLSSTTIAKMNYIECDVYMHIKTWCDANDFPFTNISWGFWNEGNTSAFWPISRFTNQRLMLQQIFDGMCSMLFGIDETFPGADFVSTTEYIGSQADWTSWYAHLHSAGMDTLAIAAHCHDYQGTLYCFDDRVVRKIEADRVAAGNTFPFWFRNGEDCFAVTYGCGLAASPQFSATPADNLHCNKKGGAWLAHRMLSCAKSMRYTGLAQGIEEHILTGVWEQNPDGSTGANGVFGITGIVNNACTGVLAPGHVMKLWQMMALDTPGGEGTRQHGSSTWSGDPGIGHLATRVSSTVDRYFLVNYSNFTRTVTIQTNLDRAGRIATRYVINGTHSSVKDNAGHLTLETVNDVPSVDLSGQMTFTMAPYETTLVETLFVPATAGSVGNKGGRGLGIRIHSNEVH